MEEWPDTIDRVITACGTQLHCGFSDEENERLRNYMLELKGSVAGRFLWQLGTTTVDTLGIPSLQNCCAVVVDSPVKPFTWTFSRLMLGSGVGYNIQRENVYKLPKVREDFKAPVRQDNASSDYIVPDTRDGWTKLLEYTLRAAFEKDAKKGFTYSTQLVRGAGAPIKGFGGTASGPEILCEGIANISTVIEARKGKQLRPIDCLDIMNIIGQIVVAGNVRRSAQIAIGDPDDLQYLRSKRWEDGVPNWRAMSNNSVVCNDITQLPIQFWNTYDGKSEPFGLINLKLSRSCGRIGDTQYKDKNVVAFNPCAEQPLANNETCCLAETFLPNIESKEELLDVVKLLYRVCKHSLALPDNDSKETEAIVNKNMRMGIGVTGYLSASDEQRSWLPWCYEQLRAYDVEYSKEKGFPVSIKLTTSKPSGTLSLLPIGITPGCHPAFATYMIRRVRIASNHALVDTCREHGFPIEYQRNFDGTEDRGTVVVSFPFSYPEDTLTAAQTSAILQLEVVRRIQTEWSDNAVSCTVYYKPEELDQIKDYLKENYNKNFKSLSFLRASDHGFVQAPLEEITKEEYDKLLRSTKPIVGIDEALFEAEDDCATGMCPIK